MKANEFKRILPVLSILSIILGLAHYFIFLSTSRSIPEESSYRTYLGIFLLVGWLSLPAGFLVTLSQMKQQLRLFSWMGYIWMGFFHLLFFSSLFEFILSLIFEHNYSYWNLFFSLLTGVYALFQGLRLPQVITHEMQGPASMKGLSIAQASDLHVGLLHLNAKWLAKVVSLVNQQKPDIFAITGDLVEGSFKEVSPQLEILKSVKPNLEKFYITGNHEYIHQGGLGHNAWEHRLRELGFTTLHNENRVIQFNQASILIAGVPDRMVRRFESELRSVPDLALKTDKKVDYKILLAHEPASRLDIKNEKCDLILSGHTHGGQIFPFGLFVRLVQPVVKGFKQMGDVLVFAHQGTGLWGPPMRWFSRGEIVILKWV